MTGSRFIHEPKQVYPAPATRTVGDAVPEAIAKDFKEANAVLAESPKASAALSRRILQAIFHHRLNIRKRDLDSEIDEFISTKHLAICDLSQAQSQVEPAIEKSKESVCLPKFRLLAERNSEVQAQAALCSTAQTTHEFPTCKTPDRYYDFHERLKTTELNSSSMLRWSLNGS